MAINAPGALRSAGLPLGSSPPPPVGVRCGVDWRRPDSTSLAVKPGRSREPPEKKRQDDGFPAGVVYAWKVCVRQKRTVGSNPTPSAGIAEAARHAVRRGGLFPAHGAGDPTCFHEARGQQSKACEPLPLIRGDWDQGRRQGRARTAWSRLV